MLPLRYEANQLHFFMLTQSSVTHSEESALISFHVVYFTYKSSMIGGFKVSLKISISLWSSHCSLGKRDNHSFTALSWYVLQWIWNLSIIGHHVHTHLYVHLHLGAFLHCQSTYCTWFFEVSTTQRNPKGTHANTGRICVNLYK